jgi:hypothetical protein
MTSTKNAAVGKTGKKKLRIKKQTIRDLDLKNRASGIKGASMPSPACYNPTR